MPIFNIFKMGLNEFKKIGSKIKRVQNWDFNLETCS